MTERLDELFSPNRLRKNWRTQQKREEEEKVEATPEHPSLQAYRQLKGLMESRFGAAELTTLNLLLEELAEKLQPLWEAEPDSVLSEPEREAAFASIYELEDLVEAYEVGRRNRRR